MKASVNGVLSFGLVNVPVGVASAVTKTNDLSFRTLHTVCKQPVGVKTVANIAKSNGSTPSSIVFCDTCNVEVFDGATLKGYEVAKGEFVYFTEDELALVGATRSPTIELRKFVKATDVNPRMVDKHYFLIPNRTINDAYGLLYQALAELKLIGVGTQSLWGKEHPCTVLPIQSYASGPVLMMQTLHLFEDMLQPDFAAPIPDKKANAEAHKLAKEIIQSRLGVLDPEQDMLSESRARVLALIEERAAGREVTIEAVKEAEAVPDLMQALRESVKKPAKKPAAKKPVARATVAARKREAARK